MKKLITTFLTLTVLTFSSAIAQQSYNQWSVGLNLGGHYGSLPTNTGTKTIALTHYGINARYMMNNRVGVMLDQGVDLYKFGPKIKPYKSSYYRTSFQLVGNLGDIFNFSSWTQHIGLLAHGGFGGSILINSKDTRNDYNIGKRQDLMLNAIVGITPQFKIGERVSLNLDLSYITNVKQNWNYDMTTGTNAVAFKNQMVNWSVGATFYLGKNTTHADWKPTVHGTSKAALNAQDKRIQELEDKIQKDLEK